MHKTSRVHLCHGVAIRYQRRTDIKAALFWAGLHHLESELVEVATLPCVRRNTFADGLACALARNVVELLDVHCCGVALLEFGDPRGHGLHGLLLL